MEMSFFGMPSYILDVCPENRDESNGNNIIKLWLQFIPIFVALHSQLRKGHTTKKDIPMFLTCVASAQKGITQKRHVHAHAAVSFMYNPEAKRRGHLLKCYLNFSLIYSPFLDYINKE
jgi:hypothetical protein